MWIDCWKGSSEYDLICSNRISIGLFRRLFSNGSAVVMLCGFEGSLSLNDVEDLGTSVLLLENGEELCETTSFG